MHFGHFFLLYNKNTLFCYFTCPFKYFNENLIKSNPKINPTFFSYFSKDGKKIKNIVIMMVQIILLYLVLCRTVIHNA